MGVSAATADFLVEARHHGVRFDRTLTIGRQTLFAGPLALRRRGLPWPRRPWVLDPLLETLGAREVVALVQARRMRAAEPLTAAPQQSDYERAWAAPTPASGPLRAAFRRAASPRAMTVITLDVLPRLVAPIGRLRSARRRSLRNRRLFRPVR